MGPARAHAPHETISEINMFFEKKKKPLYEPTMYQPTICQHPTTGPRKARQVYAAGVYGVTGFVFSIFIDVSCFFVVFDAICYVLLKNNHCFCIYFCYIYIYIYLFVPYFFIFSFFYSSVLCLYIILAVLRPPQKT